MNFDLFSIQSAIICVAYFAAGVIDSVCECSCTVRKQATENKR